MTRLTPELQRRLVVLLRAGNFVEVAVRAVGISRSAYYNWIARGEREQSGIYHEFAEEVTAARAQAECRAVAVISKAAERHWQAAAWFLERSAPERWGKREAPAPRPEPVVLTDEALSERPGQSASSEPC